MILKVLVIGILIYLIWAIMYHKKDKSLTLSLILEYLLFAALALILLMGVII